MASSREYLEYVLDQLSLLEDISYRYMMGEYIIYYQGKVVGGIYDDRFLVKNLECSRDMMPTASLEIPYEKGSSMILVNDIENKEFLKELFDSMIKVLPYPKTRKKLINN